MAGVAPQAVQLPHSEYVAGLQPVQGSGELRALDRGSADAVVGEGPGCAGGLECRELQIKVLFSGGNPRVGRPHILLKPSNLP